jgi:hypothetical protein
MGAEVSFSLSPAALQAFFQCPRRFWLESHEGKTAKVPPLPQSRVQALKRIRELAEELFPGGVVIERSWEENAADLTRRLLAYPPRPLFEAVFEDREGMRARADILLPEEDGWRLLLLSLSVRVGERKTKEAAMVGRIIRRAGLPLAGIGIMHIDSGFIYAGKDYKGLLQVTDISAEAEKFGERYEEWAQAAQLCIASDKPAVTPGSHCVSPPCPFARQCEPAEEYPVEILPRIGARAGVLRANGFADLRDVPEEALQSAIQRRVRRATRTGRTVLDKAADEYLRSLSWPRHYLDFESIQPELPRWRKTKPYQQIPFQWSLHTEEKDGTLRHDAFLASGKGDPRRPFLKNLLAALPGGGPILVYNAAFENSRLEELALAFPTQAEELRTLRERVVDLLPLARKYYYHPAMRGSWSIKAVLPTIAPELDYGSLDVGDGQAAQETFFRILAPETFRSEKLRLRKALLLYCERDTLALVRLARFFSQGIPENGTDNCNEMGSSTGRRFDSTRSCDDD